jgi:uncharacterized membrane protein YhhN
MFVVIATLVMHLAAGGHWLCGNWTQPHSSARAATAAIFFARIFVVLTSPSV